MISSAKTTIVDIPQDFTVFGHQVMSFPNGIAEAFDSIVDRVPDGFARSFYGLSKMDGSRVVYLATAIEQTTGEGRRLGYDTHVIKKGKYVAVTIKNWRSNVNLIQTIFESLMNIPGLDPNHWAVEWYKNDNEMDCMLRMLDDE